MILGGYLSWMLRDKTSKLFFLVCFLLIAVFAFVFAGTSRFDINLYIEPGPITCGSPQYLYLGQINLSPVQQQIQGQFTEHFWVSDLMSSDDGYLTTVVSDGLVGSNGVVLTGIYLSAGNNGVPELLLGTTGNVNINNLFSGDFYSIFETPVTYIYRPQGPNNGKINKYGDRPMLKIIVPAYTQPGTYSGTIYFDI